MKTNPNFYKTILFVVSGILLLFAQSCEEYIDYELDSSERKIVLNGFINPNEPVKINLSKSVSAADYIKKVEYISNAKVELYENNILVSELIYDELGFYISDFKPSENKTYTIKAEAEGFKNVYAQTTVPSSVSILEINDDNLNIELYTEYGYSQYNIEGNLIFKFARAQNSNNFFLVNTYTITGNIAYNYETNEPVDTLWTKQSLWYNPAIESNTTTEYLYIYDMFEGFVFSDEFSKSNFFDVNIAFSSYFSNNSSVNSEKRLYFDAINFDETFFNYLKSKNLYSDNDGNPFSEPVNVYSNVTNGLGLFTAYSIVTDSIVLVSNK